MILDSLTIRRNQSYDTNPAGYTGSLRLQNRYGAIELALNEQVSAKILAVIGDSAVESAKDIAQQLSATVFSQPVPPRPVGIDEAN